MNGNGRMRPVSHTHWANRAPPATPSNRNPNKYAKTSGLPPVIYEIARNQRISWLSEMYPVAAANKSIGAKSEIRNPNTVLSIGNFGLRISDFGFCLWDFGFRRYSAQQADDHQGD